MIAIAAPVGARERLNTRRRLYEQLALLADELDEADRDLILSVIERGQTIAALARAAGVNRRSLSRRFTRLALRLSDERIRIILREREQWPALRRKIATLHIVQGRTQRDTARRLRISLHRLRNEVRAIEALVEAERATSKRRGRRS